MGQARSEAFSSQAGAGCSPASPPGSAPSEAMRAQALPAAPRRHACPAQPASPSCGLYARGLLDARIQPQQRRPAAPVPHGAAARRPHAQAGPLRGGETPPRDPPPPQQRGHGAERPVPSHARHGQPPAPLRPWRKRARGAAQTAGLSAHGAEAGGWRRPACGGWPSLAGIGRPRVGAGGRRATLARDRAPPKRSGVRSEGRAGDVCGTQGAALDPPGAPPLDPGRGQRPPDPQTRPGASPWTPPRRA